MLTGMKDCFTDKRVTTQNLNETNEQIPHIILAAAFLASGCTQQLARTSVAAREMPAGSAGAT